jgi:hypothetical protein
MGGKTDVVKGRIKEAISPIPPQSASFGLFLAVSLTLP